MDVRKSFLTTLHNTHNCRAGMVVTLLLTTLLLTPNTADAVQKLPSVVLAFEAIGNYSGEQEGLCVLAKDQPARGKISGGEVRACQIIVTTGQFLHIAIESRDIDVVVVVVGPKGTRLAEADTRETPDAAENLLMVANESGVYRFEVKAPNNKRGPGSYEMRILELREATRTDRELQRARDLEAESIQLKNQGKYSDAFKPGEEAAAIREKLLGQDSIELAASLLLLGELSQVKGEFDKAFEQYKRSIAITEKILGKYDPRVALALGRLGTTYYQAHDLDKATLTLDRAMDIWEKSRDPSHPLFAESLESLAGVYEEKGDYVKAEPLYLRGLSLRESRLDPDNMAIAASLNNLALLYYKKGEYTRAEEMYNRALVIDSKSHPQDNPETAFLLNNLAIIYRIKGDYSKATPLYQRVLKVREKEPGTKHPYYAASLNNLALVYALTGDYQKAEENYLKSLNIFENATGKNSPEVAATLNNLAFLYHLRGEDTKAEPLLQRVIVIKESTGGADHPDIAVPLNTLALLYEARGDYAKAEPILTRALMIVKKKLSPDHPEVALTYNNFGLVQYSQRDYSNAESSYQNALAIWKKTLGEHHPNVAAALNNLALLYEVKGEIKRAIESRTLASEITERNIVLNLVAGSERQKLLYLTSIKNQTEDTLSLQVRSAPSDAAARRLALTTVLRRKGRALDAVGTSFALLRQRLTPESQTLLDRLRDTRARLSGLIIAGPARSTPEQYQALLKKLEDTAADLEEQISRKSEEFRAQSQPVTLESVQGAIPQGASLVEFTLHKPRNAQTMTATEQISPRYLAYVLPDKGEPQWVNLGDAVKIDAAINNLRQALRTPTRRDVRQLARELDDLMMRPVRKLLGQTRTVFLSPDGLLNLVPFAALVDERGESLIKNYSFTYLSSGRDLLRLGANIPSKQGPVVVANPDFGAASVTKKKSQNRDNSTGILAGAEFKPLPGAAVQARELKKLMPDSLILTGGQATESAVKAVKSPVILHVATHGFFLTDADDRDQAINASADVMGIPIYHPAEQSLAYNLTGSGVENALLRSGLALSGANLNLGGPDDGILTGLEAASLDLWGTKLVVLSACDTGVGEVKSGEGVYGLRRSLVLAGSESQVISLWRVSDVATRDLMINYYRALAKGEGRSEALRIAQLQMLQSVDRWHPYYWAGFIESGSWASINSTSSKGLRWQLR